MTSSCEVLHDNPYRFLHYVFADPRLRKGIVDKKSFAQALEKALRSDSSLKNIADEITGSGESMELCGTEIFEIPDIQELVNSNLKEKTKLFRGRIKNQYPNWKRGQIKKELDRRLKILIGTQAGRMERSKQIVSISKATVPIKVEDYYRDGKLIEGYRKTEQRKLNIPQEKLIVNSIKRGKTPKETVKSYYDSGLEFRSEASITGYYWRLKFKLGL